MGKIVKNIRLWDDNPHQWRGSDIPFAAVRIEFDHKRDWAVFDIDELLKILELWIIGEEMRYPQEKGFKGRWMLFEKIKEVFEKTEVKKMDTTKYAKSNSDWLMATDVINGITKVAIIDEGEEYTTNFGKKIFRVKVDNQTHGIKWMKLNYKSMQRIHKCWGTESKNWVGKILKLDVELTGDKPSIVASPTL